MPYKPWLLYFLPHCIFHCGLYCRAVYNAERLIFHDYFFATKNQTEAVSFYICIKEAVVYNAVRFVLQETFLILKICGL